MQDYEKLGVFYLGREHDLASGQTQPQPLLYDSKDMVTHAVCVGMTGSGKTGLCLSILEEAAIDGIPAIVIDPKGDLANLMLTFPNLQPADFRPWIDADDARRQLMSEDDFAAAQAKLWSDGLAKWDQDGARIGRLKGAADFAIFTPGSSAGIPVSILRSFDAPAQSILDDEELFADRVATTATSLLGLLGIDADPVQSREHILISNLLTHAWSAGQSLDMPALIQQIQQPPMDRIGVLDVNAFFAEKDRTALATKLNNLLAAPAFAQWMNGVPLDIQSMLYGAGGKPRIAIFSIAHLGDAERMFFVSLLLNQVLGWMRTQGGTTSLRAMLYMDEIYGYFPPSANPPSKQPLLTLLKQARAFGVGVMLTTQNPVDLDYKGLANCGTWFIGRLQTERDKARLLDGLEGAAAGANKKFDAARMGETLAGLGNRIFLMNNVHDDEPVVFESRWCMSYLRGPLAKPEIKRLMDPVRANYPINGSRATPAKTARSATADQPPAAQTAPASAAAPRPVLPAAIPQYFLPLRGAAVAGASLTYVPKLFGTADVYFNDKASGVTTTIARGLLADIVDGPVPVEWTSAAECDLPESELSKFGEPNARFAALPVSVAQPKTFNAYVKSFADGLYRTTTLDVFKADALELSSAPGETDAAFRVRVSQKARELRDAEVDAIRRRYGPKLTTLQDRFVRAQQAKAREQAQASQAKWSAVMSVAGTVLSSVFGGGRRSTSFSGATAAARSAGRAVQQSGDVGRANDTVERVQADMNDLNAQMQADVDALNPKYDPATMQLEKVSLRPRKVDIKPRVVALAWTPHWEDTAGNLTPAWA